jgi:ABC-2 type transport system permease protein
MRTIRTIRTKERKRTNDMVMADLKSRSLPHGGYGVRQAIRAELSKFTSIRSTPRTLLVTVAGTLLVTVLATNGIHAHGRGQLHGFDATNQSLTGLVLGSLAIGVLGVLMITGEYSSGTIRSSLAATPRRPLFLGAKMAVIATVSLVVGEILTFACFFIGRAILSGRVPVATLGQPGVLRALLLSGAFLALLGMFGLGLGVIIRSTAGALAAFVGLIFVLPGLLQTLNSHGNPARFAPEQILANSVAAVVPQSGQLSSTTGFLLMVLYCAVTLGIGAFFLVRRDA